MFPHSRVDPLPPDVPNTSIEVITSEIRALYDGLKYVAIGVDVNDTYITEDGKFLIGIGSSYRSTMLNDYHAHEIAHGIQCSEERFGLENWGMGWHKPFYQSPKEREFEVFVIQIAIAPYLGISRKSTESFLSEQYAFWYELRQDRSVTWLPSIEERKDFLPTLFSSAHHKDGEALLKTYQERLANLDRNPERILARNGFRPHAKELHV